MKKKSVLFLSKNIMTLFMGILLCINGFAQQSEKIYKINSETPAAAQMKMISATNNLDIAREGTYQIVHVLGAMEDVVPQTLMEQIESYRTQDQIIYLKAGENTTIKILPYNEILAQDFKPVSPVIYVEEKFE